MKWIILFLLMGGNLVLGLQDFRTKTVNVFVLIFCGIMAICSGLYTENILSWLRSAGLNLVCMVFLLSALTLYFTITRKKFINIIDTYLGLGDVLFYTMIALCMSTVNFFFYLNGSLLLALVVTLCIKGKKISITNTRIPLVGYAVIFFVPYYAYTWHKNLIYNNEWILQWIY
jgi:hypothetical protein